METLEHLLAAHPFFRDLDPAHLTTLNGCAKNVRFSRGQMLLREGDSADQFFLIREGSVAVETHVEGSGPVTVQTLGAGEILGWSWLVPPYLWRFDARALGDVHAFSLDGDCLRAKCDSDPRLGYELLKRFARVMAERLEAARMQLLDVYGSR